MVAVPSSPTSAPTVTPSTTGGPPPDPVFDTPYTTPPTDIHKEVDDVVAQGGGGEDEQFWISVQTEQMLLVTASTIEAAIAKAVVNFDGQDPDIVEANRDVHVCAHGSADAHDEYDTHEGEEEAE